MAQKFLDVAQAGAAGQEVGGERVAQGVRRDPAGDAGLAGVLLDDDPYPLTRQTHSSGIEEEGLLLEVLQEAEPPLFQVLLQGRHGPAMDGEDPLLSALAEAAHRGRGQVDVIYVQGHDLAGPHAGGIKKLEERPVAQGLGRGSLGRLRQQPVHVLPREDSGQGLLHLGRFQGGYGVVRDAPFVDQETEEGLDGGHLAGHGR